MDKSLFFLTLSLTCVWLIIDSAIGKDYLGNFLGTLFPFMGTNTTGSTEQDKEAFKDTPQVGGDAKQFVSNGFGRV